MFLELLILSPVYILLPPIFFIISITLLLAVIGQSLGVRRLYIDFLLKVFEVVVVSKNKLGDAIAISKSETMNDSLIH